MEPQPDSQSQHVVRAEPGFRRRTRRACEPCRLRKRKCNGQKPCPSCTRFEYDCYFVQTHRKNPQTTNSKTETPPGSLDVSRLPHSVVSEAESLTSPSSHRSNDEATTWATSGIHLPHALGLKLNPTDVPKIQAFGWNLGLRYHHAPSARNLVWIISKAEWQGLFDAYMLKVFPVYDFLDVESVLSASSRRWEDPHATNAYDHVLCGVAALGSLFSSGWTGDRERLLVECSKDILESETLLKVPNLPDAQAWLLRTLYLRCNSSPHAAWMASCTTMQIIEASGLHQETTSSQDQSPNLACGRRCFWVAKLLNSWISFEYGRSRFCIRGTSRQLPTSQGRSSTPELISLLEISEILDPSRNDGPEELEKALTQVEGFKFGLAAITLSQSNLCFAIYRRLRIAKAAIKDIILEKVIAIGCKGLQASLEAMRDDCPWWHVSNVPFQFVCVLLAMDTSESIMLIGRAIQTLRAVVDRFQTPVLHQALATVESLVNVAQKRKEQDVSALRDSLNPQAPQQDLQVAPAITDRASDLIWEPNLLELPSLDTVDWNQFWASSLDENT